MGRGARRPCRKQSNMYCVALRCVPFFLSFCFVLERGLSPFSFLPFTLLPTHAGTTKRGDKEAAHLRPPAAPTPSFRSIPSPPISLLCPPPWFYAHTYTHTHALFLPSLPSPADGDILVGIDVAGGICLGLYILTLTNTGGYKWGGVGWVGGWVEAAAAGSTTRTAGRRRPRPPPSWS